MTQLERVLEALRANIDGVCGTLFLKEGIPRYAARIGELRSAGHNITRVKCPYFYHTHSGNIASYRLDPRVAPMPATPDPQGLVAVTWSTDRNHIT